MKLMVAEKPSVGQSIANVLGKFEKKKGYLQNEQFIVSWCVGHLVRLCNADEYREDYKSWKYADLPILPSPWKMCVQAGKQEQFAVLERWMNDSQITEIICATDAGREGESIFRWVYEQVGCKKPVKRLWISSMEERAIREGLEHLQDSTNYDNLYQSAWCRAKADWAVGINATRLFSVLYHQKKLNIGRVMTPTLALVVQREEKISQFQPEPFFTVLLDCGGFSAVSERIADSQTAEQMQASCDGQSAVIQTITKKSGSEQPPKLYDLTSLQRESNRLLGYTAQQTLDHLQSLYEKKLVTYPRTDSQYLTDEMERSTLSLVEMLQEKFLSGQTFSPDIKRLLNNAKVSDHHAILPTVEIEHLEFSTLPQEQQNILILVTYKLLCACAPKHSFETTKAEIVCADQHFIAKGKTVLQTGWKDIERQRKEQIQKNSSPKEDLSAENHLPALQENQIFHNVFPWIKQGMTSPPQHFTEDTLLSAMETAGNDAMDEDSEKKGLGTPATRAATIEKLVTTGMVERKNKFLFPTQKGVTLVTILPEQLKSPRLTAEWENSLNQIAKGQLAPDTFMQQIEDMVKGLVQEHSTPQPEYQALFPHEASDKEEIGKCPRCQSSVYESQKSFYCSNQECKFALWKNDRFFTGKKKELTKRIATELLKKGQVSVKGLYSEKTGKTYDATILLKDTGGQYVNFVLEFSNPPKGGQQK